MAKCILIAEDDGDVRDLLVELLTAERYDVLTAIDGIDALDMIRRRRPDLILLDIGMPRLDGPGFCQAYRGSGGAAPIILITAASPRAVATNIAACGAAGYIPKPFDINAVLDTIARHLPPSSGEESVRA